MTIEFRLIAFYLLVLLLLLHLLTLELIANKGAGARMANLAGERRGL